MTEPKTGWEADKKKHFDEIAENYDMIRPRYPAKFIEDIIAICGAGKKAVEIGAGTGIATEPFLRAGFDVTAIEIGEKMAGFMQDKLNSCGNLDIIVSSFEEANLPENSFDIRALPKPSFAEPILCPSCMANMFPRFLRKCVENAQGK